MNGSRPSVQTAAESSDLCGQVVRQCPERCRAGGGRTKTEDTTGLDVVNMAGRSTETKGDQGQEVQTWP